MGAWGGRMWENDDASDASHVFAEAFHGRGPISKKEKPYILFRSNAFLMKLVAHICSNGEIKRTVRPRSSFFFRIRRRFHLGQPWAILGIAHFVLASRNPFIRHKPFFRLVETAMKHELMCADEWEKRANRRRELEKFWRAFKQEYERRS